MVTARKAALVNDRAENSFSTKDCFAGTGTLLLASGQHCLRRCLAEDYLGSVSRKRRLQPPASHIAGPMETESRT